MNPLVASLTPPPSTHAHSALLPVATHYIDNHNSDYLGMVVQLYVQAHLSHYHIILTQEEYSQKLVAQLKFCSD